jgi:hypothetical protein
MRCLGFLLICAGALVLTGAIAVVMIVVTLR